MSSRRQRSIPLGGRYRQVSLYKQWRILTTPFLHYLFVAQWTTKLQFYWHNDVIIWKRFFSHYWPFVNGIQWSLVYSLHNGPVMWTLMFLWCESEQTVEQTIKWSVSWDNMTFMWRHCNDMIYFHRCKNVRIFPKSHIFCGIGTDYVHVSWFCLNSFCHWPLYLNCAKEDRTSLLSSIDYGGLQFELMKLE